ncbi:MAG: hypothetical protein ACO20W_05820 [Anaerohalosphaeraceae bacterium]
MKNKINDFLMILFAGVLLVVLPTQAETNDWKDLRSLPFEQDYPTKASADRLHDEMLFHRSTQVVLWSMPAMTLWAMKKGSEAQFKEDPRAYIGISYNF